MIDGLLSPAGPGPHPPPNGFVSVLHAARRRRMRKMGAGAACTGAALAVLVGLAVPGGSMGAVSGLEPVSRPDVVAPASTPRPAPPAASPPRGPAAPGLGGYRPSVPAPGTGSDTGPWPRAGRTAGPHQATPRPSAPPRATGGSEPVVLTYVDQDTTAPCQDVRGWCVAAAVEGGATAPTRDLRLSVCRSVASAEERLYFERAEPADFTIQVGDAVVWRWQPDERGRVEPYDVEVDRWQCAVWSTPWHRVDLAGRPARPGTYTLSARSHAVNLHEDGAAVVDFTVG